jgi:hypothetical protein
MKMPPLPFFLFLGFAVFSLVSVFFRHWDLRWGTRQVSGKNGVPLSVRSRVFFACYFGYLSLVTILVQYIGSYFVSEGLIAGAVPLLFLGYKMFSNDKKNSRSSR